MDKEKLIAYVSGSITNHEEKKEIFDWINASPANRQEFIVYKNTYALSRKSSGKTDTELEFFKFQSKTGNRYDKFTRQFVKYAAIILITFGVSWLSKDQLQNWMVSENQQTNKIICPAGQISEVILADGTKIWLNAGSTLSYPTQFNKNQRTVHLSGEAFFEVNKSGEVPFIVNTKTLNIKVLGTSFNVDAYNETPVTKTTLVEGKIELLNKQGSRIAEIKPGQLAEHDPISQKILLHEVDTRFYSSWKEGKMTFFNETLENIAVKLERWYNVEFVFKDEEIKTERFSGTFLKYKPLDQILEIIKLSSQVNSETKINPEGKNEIILSKLN